MKKSLIFSLVAIACIATTAQTVRLKHPLSTYLIPSYDEVKSYVGGFKPYWERAGLYGSGIVKGGIVGAGLGSLVSPALYYGGIGNGDWESHMPTAIASGAALSSGAQLFKMYVYRSVILNALNRFENKTMTDPDIDSIVACIGYIIDSNNYLHDYLTNDEIQRLMSFLQLNRESVLEGFNNYPSINRFGKMEKSHPYLFKILFPN